MSIGDRMKNNYENRARYYLVRRTPVIIRVDGKAFHTLTGSDTKPFSQHFMDSMAAAAKAVSEQIQGFKAAYVQSDEVSFLVTDYDDINTEAWFDYNKSKLESITAAVMSVIFSRCYGKIGYFDSRAFNMPEAEVANYFLWRVRDWERNSLSMYSLSFFTHKQLHGKSRADRHEMLHSIDKNWATDLSERERNGVFFTKEGEKAIEPNYARLSWLIDEIMPPFTQQERQQ